MAHDIFISYTRADLERVKPIVEALQKLGWTVWWDRRLTGGARFSSQIIARIKEAKAVIVVWSHASISSEWVESEAIVGRKLGYLVPVRLDEVSPPLPFTVRHTVDCFDVGPPSRETLKELARALVPHTGLPVKKPSQGEDPGRGVERGAERRIRRRQLLRPATSSKRRGFAVAGAAATAVALAVWAGAGGVKGAGRATGKVPSGWRVVDPEPGAGGWARRIAEPKTGIELVLIPPGEFWMGSPIGEEDRDSDEQRHRVRISQPFYLGATEVTEGQAAKLGSLEASIAEQARLPLSNVSYAMAREFCELLGCELPTEAQWEYAARAGSEARWSWGDLPAGGERHANLQDKGHYDSSPGATVFPFHDGQGHLEEAGHYDPNGWGLHDMTGNVWEWVFDSYDGGYPATTQTDPVVNRIRADRVARGGSFATPVEDARIANRHPASGGEPIQQNDKVDQVGQTGFRIALNPR